MLSIEDCKAIYLKPTTDEEHVVKKYTAMMTLRTIGNEEAAKVLEEGYALLGESELLRHDVMYCMGQMRVPRSLTFLLEHMNNPEEQSIVRHEAGEALANYHQQKDEIIPEMKKHWDSEDSLLKSTVHVGVGKLETLTPESSYGKKYQGTIEPAEPFSEPQLLEYFKKIGIEEVSEKAEIYKKCLEILLKPYSEIGEFYKYRICYYLRNEATPKSKEVLCELLKAENREVISPLLRHELGFILGQINEKDAVIEARLKEVSVDETEHPVVRHEAILSFYDVTKDQEFIDQFVKHENQLIRESVKVAIAMGDDH